MSATEAAEELLRADRPAPQRYPLRAEGHGSGSCILGTGRAVPATVLTNEDLGRRLSIDSTWIVERTGIHTRRILESNRSTSDLAVEASQSACAAAGLDPQELEC